MYSAHRPLIYFIFNLQTDLSISEMRWTPAGDWITHVVFGSHHQSEQHQDYSSVSATETVRKTITSSQPEVLNGRDRGSHMIHI